ncbi:MAG: hypothetical protein ABW321_06750 [Polyangiales bacterium]
MRRATLIFIAGSAVAGLGSGYYMGRVQANRAPEPESLTYSGTLTDPAGKPVDETYQLTLNLFASAVPAEGEQPTCTVGPLEAPITQGHFSIDVSACAAVLQATPEQYTELTAKTGENPEVKLGRSKIGAVPFALEARHSVIATQATQAAGDLQAQLAAVTARLDALEAAARNVGGALEVQADLAAPTNALTDCIWTDYVDSAVVGDGMGITGPAFDCPDGRFVAGLQLANTPGVNTSVDMVKLRCCEL